jgi:hypothetical protein
MRIWPYICLSYFQPGKYGLKRNRDATLVEPAYWLIDASVRYRFGAGERFDVTVWAAISAHRATAHDEPSRVASASAMSSAASRTRGIRFFGLSLSARI